MTLSGFTDEQMMDWLETFVRNGLNAGLITQFLDGGHDVTVRDAISAEMTAAGPEPGPTMDELLSIYEEAFHGSEEAPGLTACRESGIRAVVQASGGRIREEVSTEKKEN